MGQEIWNLLAIIGGIRVAFWARKKAQEIYHRIKHRKARRQAQKSRLNSYRHRYKQTPISIAKEYADEIKRKPIRKATGLFSDAAAQKYVL